VAALDAQVAETIALTGPHPVARWAYDALSPYAGLVVVEGSAPPSAGRCTVTWPCWPTRSASTKPRAGHRAAAVAGARALGAAALGRPPSRPRPRPFGPFRRG